MSDHLRVSVQALHKSRADLESSRTELSTAIKQVTPPGPGYPGRPLIEAAVTMLMQDAEKFVRKSDYLVEGIYETIRDFEVTDSYVTGEFNYPLPEGRVGGPR